MQITLGFLIVLLIVIFPGLIYRRLYYYGEFSKQFSSNFNLIKLLSIAAIPGLVNLLFIFLFYDNLIEEIDLGAIIDRFKDVNDPSFKFKNSDTTPLKSVFSKDVLPFLGFLYLTSIILGLSAGRLVRITKLDTKFKLLRFKNYWFYLFNGQQSNVKKMKHLATNNKNHLFTYADVLIDTESNSHLYSGVVVDYELEDRGCNTLSKIMLRNAKRYSLKEGKRVPLQINGALLVVDCGTMKNINLTYVYEKATKAKGFRKLLHGKLPILIEISLAVVFLVLLPLSIYKFQYLDLRIYDFYFSLTWYARIIAYVFICQIFGLFNPFIKKKEGYKFVDKKILGAKIALLIILGFLIFMVG